MDFTIKTYKRLLKALKESGYTFQPFVEFIQNPAERAIVLRHDVDAKKWNSYRFAKIEAGMEIKGTYYFRIAPKSFSRRIIREMTAMGHEIGYHYETMDTARGDVDKAYDEFYRNLKMFRKLVPVKTICMHGSPLSKYDNRSIWGKYDYKELGIIGEPYLDIDFNKVLYLTDTGRRWDGERVSVRDKVTDEIRYQKLEIRYQKLEIRNQNLNSEFGNRQSSSPVPRSPSPVPEPVLSLSKGPSYHSTNDIINAAEAGKLPNQIMLTFHPQRWTDRPLPWLKELIWQNMKNQVKKFIVR